MLGTLKFMLFDIVANLHKLVNKEPYRKVNVLSEKLKNQRTTGGARIECVCQERPEATKRSPKELLAGKKHSHAKKNKKK